ncbi:GumC family protein [Agrobacterium tumefaciens]|uniref:GumC family protein n=1 Tax=Agrobacterium tumefaciens TaxID=358 RepID=UPI0015727031|nr:polysaccharide biosynthesis tyrosine autokinase [Agrobacterium tumefaciens]NTA43511.1 polysaccharide biosynthesis tyrosine autokinase [Agrobacterium tumefaciens]WIE35512.1 polysaccharide biosynthesis tyrosine autokinase [Agrobacterium tumefaciens]
MIQSSSSPVEQEGISRFISILRERRRAVFICFLASFAIAAIGYALTPIRYKAEATLALDVRKLQALPTESVVSPLPQESPVLRTELDIIGSRSMAERVLVILQKDRLLEGRQTKSDRTANDAIVLGNDAETSKMIDNLMTNVRVMNDGRSYTIYISYYANDPALAAKVANAFGAAYIDYQIDLQTTATRRVSAWLGERLVSLRTELEESERQASQFREKSGLIDTGGLPLQSQRLSSLNVELTTLQAKLAGSRARLATALELQKSGDGLGITEVLSSPSIQLLRAEQARVIRAIAQIDESGAVMSPERPQLSSQLSSLNKQIDSEIAQIIAALRNEIEVNEKQRQEVEASLNDVQRAISTTDMAMVQSGQLDREAAANRSIYETYLARYKQTIEQDGIATAEARIISSAMPSRKPTSPDERLWALVALLLGCSTGLAAAFILNFTDRSVGSITSLQQKTGLNVIGSIPRISFRELQNTPGKFSSGAADFYSAFADLQTHIQLAESKAKVIAFTSSADGEGKTFVIANLARSLAMSGVNLLLIDANLRNPALGGEFDVGSTSHVGQAVSREVSLDDIIQRDQASGVDIIVAEKSDLPPNLVLGSKRFAGLIAEARQRYELVLIEAPSVSHDLDLLRIATLSDAVSFVVRQDVADGTGMKNAVIKLRVAGRPITGIILNGIRRPKKRHPPVWPRIFRDWNTHFKLRKRATSLRPPAVVHSER